MPTFSIRSERAADVDAIDAVTKEAFANHPLSSQTEHFIVRSLRHAQALTISLVAEAEGLVVGHVAVSPVQVAGKHNGWFGLGPISVATAHQRQGVGSALVRAAIAQLQASGAAGCVLLGNPDFYRRFGFTQDQALLLPGAPPEHFMSLAWKAPVPSGPVSYHGAFNAVA